MYSSVMDYRLSYYHIHVHLSLNMVFLLSLSYYYYYVHVCNAHACLFKQIFIMYYITILEYSCSVLSILFGLVVAPARLSHLVS